ncbi:MAG: hypothetical protein DMG69_18995 [Acidobacteria bacterium]|nr:MAG: hypothetical protein DMG69_18995 [Acidobacteriota bacterium]
MTFAHYEFVRGSSVHEHCHPQEEVWNVIEGEMEMTNDGVTQIARPGVVGIVPRNVRPWVKALRGRSGPDCRLSAKARFFIRLNRRHLGSLDNERLRSKPRLSLKAPRSVLSCRLHVARLVS